MEPACAEKQEAQFEEGAKVFFGRSRAKLSEIEKRDIYSAMDIRLAPDRKSFIVADCAEDQSPTPSWCIATYDIESIDLNKDGIQEVFVTGGNTFTSGATGSSIWLFVRQSDGSYSKQLGFPACCHTVLRTRNKGYPDLRFGGPGFCESVWRWNGTEYKYLRNIATAKGGCDNR